MATNLFTLGYENASIEDFISTLKEAEIELIIDVRELPLSRKKGFSKNILNETLIANGIEYVHLKGLGDPKEGRDAAKSGNMAKFIKIFSSHMLTEKAKADLDLAVDLASLKTACLLCYERDHHDCHRTIVAKAISQKTNQAIRPIGVRKGIASSCDHQIVTPMRDYEVTYA
jgi:uncharacterized protein (DUF488 family)